MTIPELIGPRNLGGIPDGETLSTAQDLDVRVVTAHFDGAGAAGPFLACVSFKSQDGTLIGRFFPSQVFAAGDSGEVTYGPFLESGGGAAPSGGYPFVLDAAGAQQPNGGAPLNVPNTTWTALANWGNVFTVGSAAFIRSQGGPNRLQYIDGAVFALGGMIEWLPAFAGDRFVRVGPSGFVNPGTDNFLEFYLGNSGDAGAYTTVIGTGGSLPAVFTDLTFEVWQNSGVAQTVSGDNSVGLNLIGKAF